VDVLIRQRIHFGPFELDPASGELFKLGHKLNLRGQPVEVLSILLERPGEVVTREELCKRLWPQDTFVDFEHSLNTAIKKLRQALDEDVETPRYIETLPKKGYRFVGKVEAGASVEDAAEKTENQPSEALADEKNAPVLAGKWARWGLAAVLLLIVIAAGGLYQAYRTRVPTVTAIHQLTRTENGKCLEWLHKVVTDGTRIYFNDLNKNGENIGQVSTKGGEVSYLRLPAVHDAVLFGGTADGSELLVVDVSRGTADPRMWLAELPNGPQRKIDDLAVTFATLTPEGKQVVFTGAADTRKLRIADVDGGGQRVLLTAPDQVRDFAVSPDGRTIRFVAGYRIWEAAMDGTGLHRFLPLSERKMCCGDWSRDGRVYAYASLDKEGYNLWAVIESGPARHRHNSSPVQLTYGPISFRAAPSFSPDSRQIFAVGQIERGELMVYDSGSKQFQPYMNGMSASFLDFSRDGQWVTYVTYPGNVLWRSRVDGSERLQLTFPPMGFVVNPKWSPDGRLIAFMEWGFPERKIWMVSADGGSPMLLAAGDFHPADPNWSSDGRSIAYGGADVYDGGGSEIRILDLETRQSRTIPGSQHMFGPRWSPDGRYISANSDDTGRLLLYSFESGRWKELHSPYGVSWPVWSHDSRYLYVLGSSISRINVEDGRAELAAKLDGMKLASAVVEGGWIGLTPDDRVIVLRDRGTEEVYALDLEYR
jgi:DNA-binding winged helix-turn-helix (wHTH) protein/Tol biopolymer transport system component